MRRRRAATSIALAAVIGLSGCTSGSGTTGATGAGTPITVGGNRVLTGAELSYGPSVGNTAGAAFKSDVVIIGGGANSIVGALDSGLVWTIKGDAPGASALAVGKVMVATAMATGRVAQVQQVGGNIQVVLAPVALTDVFERLDVKSSSPVTLAKPLAYSYANSPVASTDSTTSEPAAPPTASVSAPPTAPAIPRFRQDLLPGSAPSVPPGVPSVPISVPSVPISVPTGVPSVSLPQPRVTPKAVHQGKFDLIPYCCFPSQGVRISYNESAGRMAATVGLVMSSKPLVDFHIVINGGGLQEAVFEINGPTAVEFGFEAATKDVSGNYKSPTLSIPLAFSFPVLGIPFTVSITQSVRASIQLAGQAAFSSKGEYAISGKLGFAYRNGKFGASTPSFGTKVSILQNATSFSAGINALSVGYEARFAVGIGVVGFTGGPFVELGAKLAIAKDGSPPTTSLTAGCATAAVSVTGSYGVGYTIPQFVANAVNSFLSLFNAQPIPASGGKSWGPYTLWNPTPGKRCLQR